MEAITPADQVRYQGMTTDELRRSFLLTGLFQPGACRLLHVETDRAVAGSAVPTTETLELPPARELSAEYLAQRREVGVLNLGGPGTVCVDGTTFPIPPRDGLYIGRGSRDIRFASDSPAQPAQFYLVSYPAHADYPTTPISRADTEQVHLGADAQCNDRTIFKYIHAGGPPSCQLVMGITSLAAGSAWNTMPCHTHARRSEIYLYFDLPEDHVILHLMGRPDETRHLIVRNREAVACPGWSIHTACGTAGYSFVWAMGGENQDFTDMDAVAMDELR